MNACGKLWRWLWRSQEVVFARWEMALMRLLFALVMFDAGSKLLVMVSEGPASVGPKWAELAVIPKASPFTAQPHPHGLAVALGKCRPRTHLPRRPADRRNPSHGVRDRPRSLCPWARDAGGTRLVVRRAAVARDVPEFPGFDPPSSSTADVCGRRAVGGQPGRRLSKRRWDRVAAARSDGGESTGQLDAAGHRRRLCRLRA